jgi:adenylate cyclase
MHCALRPWPSCPRRACFADGITEDVTTDLSRVEAMFVISRNTAFTYRNKPVDTKQIGRELGVRYVLEGSVRRSGNQVRVNAQLIDAESDAHLWAERFDGNTSDLFALQDEITARIGNTLNIELTAAEAARPTENPDALDYILQGRAASFKPPSRENRAEAISLFERALALDPRSVEAQSRLASALAGRVLDYMSNSAAADIARAEELAGQALAASPRSPLAHFARGQVLRAQRRSEEAIPEYETVLAANRNWVGAFAALGQCKLYTGSIEETIPLEEQAIRLSPRDPNIGMMYFQIGRIHLLQTRTDEAITWLEKARSATPAFSGIRAWLSSAYALKAKPNAPLPNSRKPAGWPSTVVIRASPALGPWDISGCRKSAPCSKRFFLPASARPECPRNDRTHRRSVMVFPSHPRSSRRGRLADSFAPYRFAEENADRFPGNSRTSHLRTGSRSALRPAFHGG